MANTVSVVIPTFRREHLLPRAITSALSQADINLIDVIVVDDSPERSARNIVRQFADPRVSYIASNTPGIARPGLARNQGAKLARGELLHFLDDDDEFASNDALSQLVR